MKKSAVVILHLGYWLFYLLLLVFLAFLILQLLPKGPVINLLSVLPFLMPFAIVPGLLSFYAFYTFLFSRFFCEKKIILLVFYGLFVSGLSSIVGMLMLAVLASFGFGAGVFGAVPLLLLMTINACVNGLIGLVLRGFVTSFGDIKLKEDLSRKNIEMELALIKLQLNPHFLFNTINNIDVLIEKDAAKASSYLKKLSDIMRFMLYETKAENTPLSKEIEYVEKYIELQKIRTSNLNYVKFVVEGDSSGLTIAPMLFMPFIENAFKYAENKKIDNAIEVKIIIGNEFIQFICENYYSNNCQSLMESCGLGNQLIEKRLALLYPMKHKLDITSLNNIYKVKLVVSL